ncbi:hypothetical protein, partial [Nostoc sp.]|uniref:hypothetical protein n=1 Tax=Nostoc sp. TaxID=1180 RepID=UPI002FFA6880
TIDNQLARLKTLPTKAYILPSKDFRTCVYTVAKAGEGGWVGEVCRIHVIDRKLKHLSNGCFTIQNLKSKMV